MNFSLKKSFKSRGSYKHIDENSVRTNSSDASSHGESSILLDQERRRRIADVESQFTSKMDSDGRAEHVQQGNGHNNAPVIRDSSYQFCSDDEIDDQENSDRDMRSVDNKSGSFEFMERGDNNTSDPPTKLIGQFLNNQKNQGEIVLDMDLKMDELQHFTHSSNNNSNTSSSPYSTNVLRDMSRELRVSFEPSPVVDAAKESMRRRYKDSPEKIQKDQKTRREEILNDLSFKRMPATLTATMTMSKTRSRLQDPPPEEIIELRSGQLRSGLLGKMGGGDDDEETLFSEDLPEEYTSYKFSALIFIEWVSLIMIVAALICSLLIHEIKKKTLWDLKLWKWEVMVLALICGRLVSGWGIRLLVFFIERNFILRKKLLYFVYGVKKPVQNSLWLGLVLVTWYNLFNSRAERETKSEILSYVTKILVCLLTGTLLWLVKTLMIKVLASSFHVSTYFDRIQESLFYQYVIETLSGPAILEIQMHDHDDDEERAASEVKKLQNSGAVLPPDLRADAFVKSGRVIGKSSRLNTSGKLSQGISKKATHIDRDGITIDHLHKLNPKNVSAWNMKRLVHMVRYGKLTTLDEQFSCSPHEVDDTANQIRSECEAKAAARKIFLNVARYGSKHIYLEDLMRFMQEEEALKTLGLFEGSSENGRISKTALKNWVVNAFRERRALALTLNDTKTAVKKLHHIVKIVVGIVILVVWLLILKIATSEFLLFLSSQLVLVAFVFGNTCKTIFEALIFLFVMHPFDVGDRCEVDGVQMIVEEMNIFTTVFLRYDNLKIVYPNSVLSTKPINNFYRSPDMLDEIEFCVHIATPSEKVALMRQRIVSYIENKKEHWCIAPIVILKNVEDFNSLRIAVWPTHKMNHQDIVERWTRRAILIEEMVKIFKELDIQYRLYPLDINVRSVPAPIVSEQMPFWTNTSSTS